MYLQESTSTSTGKASSTSSSSRTYDTDIEAGERRAEMDEKQILPANGSEDLDLVVFNGADDPIDPRNFRLGKKLFATISMGMMTFVVTFSSSVFANAVTPISREYNVSTVTATLGVSLFLLGFVLGPVVFGPASEIWGRKAPLFVGYMCFAMFQIPVALARNVETILICRFVGGFAASAALAIVGGCLADLWAPVERAYAICAFAGGAFSGPVAGPIVGGFVAESYLGWRWTQWITLIMAALFGGIGLFLVPETSAHRILQIRAKELRYQTKNWALHAKADENPVTFNTICTVYLVRPWKMIVQEPILALLTAYMSYLYSVLYLLFQAFPISFHEERGWSLGVSALPFASIIVGIVMGCALMAYSTRTHFQKAFIKHGKPIPEERLPPMILCGAILPIAFFWWAWTSSPSIHWASQVIASAFLGMGLLVTFWQGMNYIIDCYGFYSNSAIAINTFIRSMVGAVFLLFAPSMFHELGVRWAASLLGFICLAFLPAPILFYKYGARIRARSKFTPTG